MSPDVQLLSVVRRWMSPLVVAAAAASVLVPTEASAVLPASALSLQHRSWWVAPHGHDSSSGSRAHPFATLQRAVNVSQPGDTVVLRGGTYHQSAVVRQHDVTIRRAGTRPVVFDGARRVSGFVKTGSRWVRPHWNYQFDHSPTFVPGAPDGTGSWQWVNPKHPMAPYPDQVWVDGRPLKQVASAAAVGPGRFAVDNATHELVIGSDPTGRRVEASTLQEAIDVRGSSVTLHGIRVRRYADSVPTLGAVILQGPHATLSHMQIVQNATSGLQIHADYVRVLHSRVSGNGLIGIHGSGSYHLLISHVRVNHNNLQRFNIAPVSGGIKMTASRHVRIKSSVFRHNLGTGVWMDGSTYDDTIVSNTITRNRGLGINLEISDTALVANNLITRNRMAGVQADNTGHVRIWNNDIIGNDRPINIAQEPRTPSGSRSGHDARRPLPDPTVPWYVQHMTVKNNVISDPRPTAICMLCVVDTTGARSGTAMGVRADANLYVRTNASAPRWVVRWSSGAGSPYLFTELASFRDRIAQEAHGRATRHAAVTISGRPIGAFTRLARVIRRPLPDDVARLIGESTGVRHLGVFRRHL